MSTKFYDTSSLLLLQEKAFDEPFITSSIILNELEHIKSSKNKTEDIRFAARKLAHYFDKYDNYEVIIHKSTHDEVVQSFGLPLINDNIIVATAYCEAKNRDIEFISEDIILRLTASNIFGLKVQRQKIDLDNQYRGFKNIILNNDEMADFYSNAKTNHFGCLINEYVLLKDSENSEVDLLKWNGEAFTTVPKYTLKTLAFGDKIKPKDSYQHMVVDSIMNNTMTVIGGKAGSGKSFLALTSAMRLIETGKYDRIVILFNPTSTRGASKLGYYGGDMIEKAMQTSIGNILTTKFGEKYAVDTLLAQGKLKLVSMADARGIEIRDNEILYITEAQNASIDLLKLALSRASQGAKVIIEGDYTSQVDDVVFEGDNNGMRRAIEVLKGEDIFGFVELQNVWRSKLAELIDRM